MHYFSRFWAQGICRGCWPQPQRLLLIEAAVASLFWPLSVNNSSLLLLLCFTLHRRVLLLKRVRVRLAWKAKVDENFFNFTHFYNLLAQKIGQLLLLLEILMSETFFQPFTHLFLFLYLAPGSFYKRGLLRVRPVKPTRLETFLAQIILPLFWTIMLCFSFLPSNM